MTSHCDTFSVICYLRETPNVINYFTQHYENLGAEKIFLLIDGFPDGANPEEVIQTDKTDLIYCDSDFWSGTSAGSRPQELDVAMIMARQAIMDRAESDWIFFCDADELLHAPFPIGFFLRKFPKNTDAVRVTNFEAVWGPGDDIAKPFGSTYMRRYLPQKFYIDLIISYVLFGRYRKLMKSGICGHQAGKHFLRRGSEIDHMTSHYSSFKGVDISVWAHQTVDPARDVFVAHYDAISMDRWVEKMRRRFSGESIAAKTDNSRVTLENLVGSTRDASQLKEVFKKLYCLSRWQYFVYAILGRCKRLN